MWRLWHWLFKTDYVRVEYFQNINFYKVLSSVKEVKVINGAAYIMFGGKLSDMKGLKEEVIGLDYIWLTCRPEKYLGIKKDNK